MSLSQPRHKAHVVTLDQVLFSAAGVTCNTDFMLLVQLQIESIQSLNHAVESISSLLLRLMFVVHGPRKIHLIKLKLGRLN